MAEVKIYPAEGNGAHIRSVVELARCVGLLEVGRSLTEGHDIDDIGWIDLLGEFGSAKGKGTTEPTWNDMGNGHYAYKFTTGDSLFVKYHVPHSYYEGTKAYPHIHFVVDQTMTVGQQITWNFNYVIARGHQQGESLTVAPTDLLITYTATGTEIAGEHIILESPEVDAFVIHEADTIISAEITLASENVVGNIFGIMADLHIQIDRNATVNKKPDFHVNI